MDDLIEADISVDFSLFKTVDSPRRSLGNAGYRPNHQFNGCDYTFMGFVDFSGGECMPGETVHAIVHCLYPEDMKKYIVLGNRWFVKEGSDIIGEAIIKKVVLVAT